MALNMPTVLKAPLNDVSTDLSSLDVEGGFGFIFQCFTEVAWLAFVSCLGNMNTDENRWCREFSDSELRVVKNVDFCGRQHGL
jgi:hypothetical protein